MKHLWTRIKALPAGLWAALVVALGVLALYLRGRRLEGELAKAKVQVESAKAHVAIAVNEEAARAHMQRAAEKAMLVQRLEKQRAQVREAGAVEQKQLAAMSPSELDEAYLRLAREKARNPR